MKCPQCEDGELTIIYENPEFVEFEVKTLVDDGGTNWQAEHGDMYDIDYGDTSRISCTNECVIDEKKLFEIAIIVN